MEGNKPEVLLIDVDGTLTKETCWTDYECISATPDQEAIDWVNKMYESNFIVIYTARRNCLYIPTLRWLERHGVKYHSVKFEKVPGKIVDRDAINSFK